MCFVHVFVTSWGERRDGDAGGRRDGVTLSYLRDDAELKTKQEIRQWYWNGITCIFVTHSGVLGLVCCLHIHQESQATSLLSMRTPLPSLSRSESSRLHSNSVSTKKEQKLPDRGLFFEFLHRLLESSCGWAFSIRALHWILWAR